MYSERKSLWPSLHINKVQNRGGSPLSEERVLMRKGQLVFSEVVGGRERWRCL